MERLIAILLFCYLALFPFGQLTRSVFVHLRGVFGPEVHLYLTDIVLTFLLLAWGIWQFRRAKRRYKFPPLAMPIFSFAIVCFLSLVLATPLLSSREVVVASLYLLRWLIYAGFYFVLSDLRRQFKYLKRKNALNFLIIAGTAAAFFGLVQYLFWPNLKALEVLEWDPHFYRVVGTFLDPGFLGLILVLTFILVLNSYLENKDSWLFLAGGLVYFALALTYSRASYLAYLMGIGIMAGFKKRPKIFLILLAVGAATILLLPRPAGEGGKLERTYSFEARVEDWQQALVVFRDHPLLGVGFNAYRYYQRDYGFLEGEKWQVNQAGAGVDSSWLFVLATTGIFGFIFYGWLWGKAFWLEKNPVIMSSLGAAFTHALFNNSLFYPWTMAWLWFLLALA